MQIWLIFLNRDWENKMLTNWKNKLEAIQHKKDIENLKLSYITHLIDIMPSDAKIEHCNRMDMTVDQFNRIVTANECTDSQAHTILTSMDTTYIDFEKMLDEIKTGQNTIIEGETVPND
jgi:hypothetical protein